jgi:hypothetical protein
MRWRRFLANRRFFLQPRTGHLLGLLAETTQLSSFDIPVVLRNQRMWFCYNFNMLWRPLCRKSFPGILYQLHKEAKGLTVNRRSNGVAERVWNNAFSMCDFVSHSFHRCAGDMPASCIFTFRSKTNVSPEIRIRCGV